MLTADQLRAVIRAVRVKTNRPFGVNLWLSSDLRAPAPAAAIADESAQRVQAALNPMRRHLGLPDVPRLLWISFRGLSKLFLMSVYPCSALP